jgi:hypothetical protein
MVLLLTKLKIFYNETTKITGLFNIFLSCACVAYKHPLNLKNLCTLNLTIDIREIPATLTKWSSFLIPVITFSGAPFNNQIKHLKSFSKIKLHFSTQI